MNDMGAVDNKQQVRINELRSPDKAPRIIKLWLTLYLIKAVTAIMKGPEVDTWTNIGKVASPIIKEELGLALLPSKILEQSEQNVYQSIFIRLIHQNLHKALVTCLVHLRWIESSR